MQSKMVGSASTSPVVARDITPVSGAVLAMAKDTVLPIVLIEMMAVWIPNPACNEEAVARIQMVEKCWPGTWPLAMVK